MKKLISCLLMVAILVIGSASAMAEEAVVGTTLFPCDENGYPDLGGVTLKIWIPMESFMSDFIESDSDLMVIQELEKKLNVNLEFIHPVIGSEAEGFSTMLASSDYPDMIFDNYVEDHYSGGMTVAYEDGLIFDYTDLVTKETAPHFWGWVMKDDYLRKSAYDDEGRLTALGARISGSEESCTCMFGLMIRDKYLKEAGLDVPETIDEWTEMLRTFKANGVTYPLVLNSSGYWKSRNAFSCAWNIDAQNFFITEDGQVAYGPATPEYKDYLSTLNMWYEEGLINPDYMNNTQSDTMSMLSDGEAGSTVDHLYTYASSYYSVVEKDNPEEYHMVAAQMPRLNKDDPLTRVMVTSRELGARKCILESSEHKEECIALLDSLYIKDIEFMFSNGIEGLGFNFDERGLPIVTTVEYDNDATVEEKRGMRLYGFEIDSDSDLEYITEAKYCNGVQPDCVKLYVQCGYDGIFPYGATFTAEESEILADVRTDVETYRDEMMTRFITGEVDIDAEFDNYIATIKSMGLDQMQEVYEASYARYLAR